jgi:putative ABC transport system ATP-binding protein
MFKGQRSRLKVVLIMGALGVLVAGSWALAQLIFGMGEYPGGTLKVVYKFERAEFGPSIYTMEVKPNGDRFDIIETVESKGRKADEIGSGFGPSGAAGAARARFEPRREDIIDLSPLAVLDEKKVELKPNERYLLPDGAVLQTQNQDQIAGVTVIRGIYTHPNYPGQRVLLALANLETSKLPALPAVLRETEGRQDGHAHHAHRVFVQEIIMIKLENVTRVYQMGQTLVQALRGLNLEIADGEFVAIMGPSGSGKSTLLHLIGGLDLPTTGRVLLDDLDIAQQNGNQLAELRGRKVGFVFQTFNLVPTLSALKNVELPMIFQKVPRKERYEKARRLLEQVGLGDRLHHKPSELSGGECQRVAIARALANNPQILLADEPTGNLDAESGEQIMQILKRLNEEQKMTIIVVTHNPDVARYAHRIIRMRYGQIEEIAQNALGGV